MAAIDQLSAGKLTRIFHTNRDEEAAKPGGVRQTNILTQGCMCTYSERPQIVESKSRIGDWEGDTIIGAKHQGAIVSYVDRYSKFTLLKKLEYKEAALVLAATVEKMKVLPHKVETITFDNGKEFARHQEIGMALNACVYFAKPYRSWERGLNEHTNGLVRQFIPKNANIHEISDEFIELVEKSLNHRPRKILGGKTPYEVFFG